MKNEFDAHAAMREARHRRAESLARLYAQRAEREARSERRAKWAVRACVAIATIIIFYSYAPVFI